MIKLKMILTSLFLVFGGNQNVVQINPSALQCSLLAVPSSHNDNNDTTKTFTFDGVYDQTSTTEQIYTDFGYPLVEVRARS